MQTEEEYFGMQQQQPQQMYGSSEADEHSLIAHYANQLAYGEGGGGGRRERSTSARSVGSGRADSEPGRQALQHSRKIVHDLEKRNRDIMRDINQLKQSHSMDLRSDDSGGGGQPNVMTELSQLRSHKDVLEDRLNELHDTRKELMHELGELMKLLQMQEPQQTAQGAGAGGRQAFLAAAGGGGYVAADSLYATQANPNSQGILSDE
jgi:hypothetical protein